MPRPITARTRALATLTATATATATALALALATAGMAVAATPPTATTGPTGTITDTTGVIGASVTPNGSTTTYYFQWGPTAGYGSSSPAHSAGSGTKPVSVHRTVTGLLAGTTYHYRVVALNSAGTTYGDDVTLVTASPPAIAGTPTSHVGTNSATITASVNPQGAETSWNFQYGTTPSYGVQTDSGSLPAANASIPVAATLRGLAAGSIFHYRLVARHKTSGSVVAYGPDQEFMTLPSPRPTPYVAARTATRHPQATPYVLNTTGKVSRPSWIPRTYACSGQVTIKSFFGMRRVGYSTAPVLPDCTFAAKTQFRRKPGGANHDRPVHLRVTIRYLGNSYLAPGSAQTRFVTLH